MASTKGIERARESLARAVADWSITLDLRVDDWEFSAALTGRTLEIYAVCKLTGLTVSASFRVPRGFEEELAPRIASAFRSATARAIKRGQRSIIQLVKRGAA